MVPDYAIMRDVDVAEEVIVTADPRFVVRRCGTVDGAKLTKGVVIAHFEPCGLSLIFQILRLLTDTAIGVKFIPFPDAGRAHDGDVMLEPATISEHDVCTDDAVWADVAVCADLGARINNSGGMNHRGKELKRCVTEALQTAQRSTTLNINSASETTWPLTRQRPMAWATLRFTFVISVSITSVSPGSTGRRHFTSLALRK